MRFCHQNHAINASAGGGCGGGGVVGVQESIVPKEGSGKATSSAVAAGTMGGREETVHTIELGGGREDVKD